MRLSFPKTPKFPKLPAGLLDYKAWEAMLLGWRAQTKSLPVVLIAAAVIVVVCLLDIARVRAFQELEGMTYDARVKLAGRHPRSDQKNAPNLGLVEITDNTIDAVNNGELGLHYGLYWPRSVYAWALQELSQQGARAVGFDVLFSGMRPDDPRPTNFVEKQDDGAWPKADYFFADEIFKSGNVILAAERGVLPARLFTNSAWQLGNISAETDEDGVLRRDRPFELYRDWHWIIRQLAIQNGLDLDKTIIEATNRTDGLVSPLAHITFVPKRGKPIEFPTDKEGCIETATMMNSVPEGVPARFQPYTYRRVWSMGIVLAARELKLDLDNPEIQPGRIVLHGDKGVVIPLEADGSFYINWELNVDNPAIETGALDELLTRRFDSAAGGTNRWKDRLVMIGSTATGNDLSDLGASPFGNRTHLVTKHLNVANSIITGRFISTSPMALRWLLIVLMGALAAWITSTVARPLSGTGLMMGVVVVYCGLACWLYMRYRFWLPIILPLVCSGFVTHLIALTYRARSEQAEKKRVKSVFSKMLAPEVVDTLLNGPVTLGGERRELSIYFADVRGFTSLTDLTQARATAHVQKNKLSPEAAKAYHDQLAKETLDTVSLYLGTIAEVIKKHNGTLDKYIGDCVMAFWGGPVSNAKHARDAVQSAVDAQRAVLALNLSREADNKRIAAENAAAAAQGLPPHSLKPLLSMGTGINSGPAIMGLMGSNTHGLNFTVFGREVNLASRLEGLSGHSRIIISEGTYQELLRDDPALAQLCVERPPADVKGFRHAVKNYEVMWRAPGAPEDPESLGALGVGAGAETGMFVR